MIALEMAIVLYTPRKRWRSPPARILVRFAMAHDASREWRNW